MPGCHNFSRPPNDVGLWLRNPQVLIVTSKKRTPLTIVLTQHATPPHVRPPLLVYMRASTLLCSRAAFTCCARRRAWTSPSAPCTRSRASTLKRRVRCRCLLPALAPLTVSAVTHTCTLPPGAYVLLFTTFKPESEGKIDIAVYSRKPIVWKPIK